MSPRRLDPQRMIAQLTEETARKKRAPIDLSRPTQDRVLVCIGPGPMGERLVRAGKLAAQSLDADWIALHVEMPLIWRPSVRARDEALRVLLLAEQYGAETVTLTGRADVASQIIEFAQASKVTRIILGKPPRQNWLRALKSSVIDDIVAGSGRIDVQISGDPAVNPGRQPIPSQNALREVAVKSPGGQNPQWRSYLAGALITTGCTAVAAVMSKWLAPTNLAMVYLLGVVLAATRFDRRASVVTAVLGTLAFDFLFIPPIYSFAISDTEYLLTAIVLLTVGLVISALAEGLRRQARVATDRERRTAALYAMTRKLAVVASLDDIAICVRTHIAHMLDAQALILLRNSDGTMRLIGKTKEPAKAGWADTSIADWVFTRNEIAGCGTNVLPASDGLYLPLNGTRGAVGVLIVHTANRARLLDLEQRHLLEAFANPIAVAVEREQLRLQAHDSAFAAQNERLRSSLLSSISHDLRSPLSVMGSSASSLLEGEGQLPAGPQRQMVQAINDEALRMTHIVNNILDMTKFESGTVRIDRQWYPLEEIVGAVLNRLKGPLGQRAVSIDIPHDLPMLHVDGVLFEKVLINLLENAAKYTATDARISVSASVQGCEIQVKLMDDGPGVPKGLEHLIFEKFYRVQAEGPVSGTGLGLAICKAIIEAHDGHIWTESRPEGGAVFLMTLPITLAQNEHTEGQVA
jgi:two-component system sensor histidine kinase KdpD